MPNTSIIKVGVIVDDKGVVQGFQNIGKESTDTGNKADRSFKKMDRSAAALNRSMKITTATIIKMGAGVAALAGAGGFGLLTRGAMESAVEIEKNSRMAGVTTQLYQELAYATGKYHVGADALTDGLKELNLRAEEFIITGGGPGKEAFERLGYSQEELNRKLKDTPALLTEVIQRMEGMENASKMRIADEIFGGQGGEQFVAVINGGAAALEGFKEEARDVGVVMDDDMIHKTIQARAEVKKLTAILSSKFNIVVAEAAPLIGLVADNMLEWVTQNKDFIHNDLPQYIRDIATEAGALGDTLAGISRNVAVNAQAFALAKAGQISWVDYITKSTNGLAVMVQQFDALQGSGKTLRQWQNEMDSLTEKYDRLGAQIERGKGFGVLTPAGLANLQGQREEIEKQIDDLNELVKVKEDANTGTSENFSAQEAARVKYWQREIERQNAIIDREKAAWERLQKDKTDAEKKRLEESTRIVKSFYDAHNKATLTNFEYSLKKLDEEYDRYDLFVQDKLALEEWYSARLKALRADQLDDLDRALEKEFAEIDAAVDDYYEKREETHQGNLDAQVRAEEKAAEETRRVWEHVAGNIHDIFADTIYNISRDGLVSVSDFFDQIWDMFLRLMSQMAAYDIMSTIGLASGGVGLFTGGSGNGGLIGNLLSGGRTGYSLFNGTGSSVLSDLSVIRMSDFATIFGQGAEASTILGSGGPGISSAAADPLAAAARGAANTVGVNALTSLFESAALGAVGILGTMAVTKALEGFFGDDPALNFTGSNGNWYTVNRAPWSRDRGESVWQAYAAELGQKSELYDYHIAAADTGQDQELVDATIQYFDTYFSGIEKTTGIALNQVLEDHKNFSAGGGEEASLTTLSKRVFGSMLGTLITQLFPDTDTVERVTQDLVGNRRISRAEFEGVDISRMSGRERADSGLLDQILAPVYEDVTRQISVLAEKFNDEFFAALVPEGGTEWDAFLRFGATVSATGDFLADFNRQVDEFGETTVDAYLNLESITAAMVDVENVFRGVSEVTDPVVPGLEAINEQFRLLTETLTAAHATTEQLNRVEEARVLALGTQITGLTATSLGKAIAGGTNVTDAIYTSIRAAFSQAAVENLTEKYIVPLNTAVGQAFDDSGDLTQVLTQLPDLLGQVGWENLTAEIGNLNTSFDSLMGDWIDTQDTLISNERALMDARQKAGQSMDDLIRQLTGGSLAPVQSLEYFERQYQDALGGVNAAASPDELNAAMGLLRSAVPDYLEYAGAYGGGNYRQTYDEVMGALNSYDAPSGTFSGTIRVTIGDREIRDIVVDVIGNHPEAQGEIQRIAANA